MADIATLGVKITTSGFKEAERDLKGLTSQGARAEQQAEKIGSAWGKRLGVAVLAGTAVAAAGVARIVQNTLEAEKVQAQLAARIKSTGGAAGLAVADLNRMADALQAATTFDDEAIGGAQALLLTFTKIGKDVFPSATEAVLNLSTAMGTDLNSAALQVGKALNDPVQGVNALARAGVTFSESQKETIKQLIETGRQAEAQRIVLQELETQMGGSARAARDTLGGALVGLGNAFDNLLEGDTGGAGILGAKTAVNELTATLNSPEVKAGFALIIEGAAKAAGTIAQLTSQVSTLAKTVGEQLAANVGGIGGDDIKRLEERATQLRAKLAEQRERFVLIDLGGNEAKIEADLKKVETQLSSFYERAAQAGASRLAALAALPAAAVAPAFEDGGTTVINAGEGFGTGKRSARSAASAAADNALAKETEQRAKDAAVAVQELLRATEDLRAELGGPLAQVQLDYIRREDELISLAKLAGLTQDELTESLGLLEQARLLDVAAIDKQIQAERQRAKEIADGPLIAQLDGLRDTTASFFVDLVKNGESAIDRLQDYLLTSALESIGKQIAEGLFGDFGTTQSGSAGSGIAGFFTSLLGGGPAGRAIGGPVSKGGLYQVGEKGQPELLNIYGKQYLIPGANGSVTPASAGGGSVMAPIYQTINVTGTIDKRSSSQIALETSRRLSQAQGRA